MNNWIRIEKENPYLKVYEHIKTGEVKIIYPKAPKWAQKAAMLIYNDLDGNYILDNLSEALCNYLKAIV